MVAAWSLVGRSCYNHHMNKLAGITAALVAAAALSIGSAATANAATIPGTAHWHKVGTGIQPGTYTSPGPTNPYAPCEWVRMGTDPSGKPAVNGSGQSRGPVTVTIKPTDTEFRTSFCGDWVRVAGPAPGMGSLGSLTSLFGSLGSIGS